MARVRPPDNHLPIQEDEFSDVILSPDLRRSRVSSRKRHVGTPVWNNMPSLGQTWVCSTSRTLILINDAIDNFGTTCPTNTIGSPGIVMYPPGLVGDF